jgi:hypothetical protein
MTTRQLAKLLALGVILALTGQAAGEENPPALNAPEALPTGDADRAVKSDQRSAKQVAKPRAKSSTRNARRKGAGPQDRSARAKRHQEQMKAQSARRPGTVSRQFSHKSSPAETSPDPASPPTVAGSPTP